MDGDVGTGGCGDAGVDVGMKVWMCRSVEVWMDDGMGGCVQ